MANIVYQIFDVGIDDFYAEYNRLYHHVGQLESAFFGLTGFNLDKSCRIDVSIPTTENFDPTEVVRTYDIDSLKGALFQGDPWPFLGRLQIWPSPPASETISGSSKYWLTINGKTASQFLGQCSSSLTYSLGRLDSTE